MRNAALFGALLLATLAPVLAATAASTPTPSTSPSPATSKLPQRNLTVELRIVSEAETQGRAAGTQVVGGGVELRGSVVVRAQPPQDAEPTVQKVFVMNGERAQLQLSQSMPVQWVKSAVQQTGTTTALSGDVTTTNARGVENSITWLDAAQSLQVLVRWSGGRQAAVIDVQVEGAAIDSRPEQNMPAQSRTRLATKLAVPLGEWSTIGVTGARSVPQSAGTYSSQSAQPSNVRLMQVRVLAP
jgi:hypothetical protein